VTVFGITDGDNGGDGTGTSHQGNGERNDHGAFGIGDHDGVLFTHHHGPTNGADNHGTGDAECAHLNAEQIKDDITEEVGDQESKSCNCCGMDCGDAALLRSQGAGEGEEDGD